MYRVIRAQSDFSQTQLRNQLTSLVLYESVTTTSAKAKQLIPFANRFFNRVKKADLAAKKLAHALLLDKNAIKKVFEEVLPRYKDGDTTFVRHLRVTPRKGDNAPQMIVLLTAPLKVEQPKTKKTTKDKPVETKEA